MLQPHRGEWSDLIRVGIDFICDELKGDWKTLEGGKPEGEYPWAVLGWEEDWKEPEIIARCKDIKHGMIVVQSIARSLHRNIHVLLSEGAQYCFEMELGSMKGPDVR